MCDRTDESGSEAYVPEYDTYVVLLEAETDYNDFVKALLIGDVRAMNVYMNRVSSHAHSVILIQVSVRLAMSRNGFTMVLYWG